MEGQGVEVKIVSAKGTINAFRETALEGPGSGVVAEKDNDDKYLMEVYLGAPITEEEIFKRFGDNVGFRSLEESIENGVRLIKKFRVYELGFNGKEEVK